MRYPTVILFLAAAGLALAAGCGPAGGRGKATVSPDAAAAVPRRIVSMAPCITETLYAIGCGDRVCGATDFCNYPEAARQIPRIGGFTRPAYERIVGLQPDLILALPEHVNGKDELQQLHLRVEVVTNRSIADILEAISRVGTLCGADDRAALLRRQLTERVGKLRNNRRAAAETVRILVTIGRNGGQQRGIADLYVAGAESFHGELIGLAGGDNVVAQNGYPMLTAESVVRLDPDVIVDLVPQIPTVGEIAQLKSDWQTLVSLSAVQNGRVYVIGGDHVLIPGPRFIQLAEQLQAVIHPGGGEAKE